MSWRGGGSRCFTPRIEGCSPCLVAGCCQNDSGEGEVVTHIPSRSPQSPHMSRFDPWRMTRWWEKKSRVPCLPPTHGTPLPAQIPTNAGQANPGAGGSHYSRQCLEWGRVERPRPRTRTVWYLLLYCTQYTRRASLFGTADGETVPTGQLLGVAILPTGGELIAVWDSGRRD